MNVLDGTVIGRNMQRHRHQEFICFLNAVEREVPAGKTIHAVLDNYAAHKHPVVRRWPARHPRWTFSLHPDFGLLAQRRRGLFRHPDQAPSRAWRLPIRRRPPGRHQPFPRRSQRPLEALPMGHRSRQNHLRRQARAPSVRFDPLSCSPFQVAGTRMLRSRASGSEWPPLSRAGGTIIKTTVDHALMRGLDTAGPVMRRELPLSRRQRRKISGR